LAVKLADQATRMVKNEGTLFFCEVDGTPMMAAPMRATAAAMARRAVLIVTAGLPGRSADLYCKTAKPVPTARASAHYPQGIEHSLNSPFIRHSDFSWSFNRLCQDAASFWGLAVAARGRPQAGKE
jgi:hypothetical protein